jgi:acyl-coenzyme A thioesterase PaaI-like protein
MPHHHGRPRHRLRHRRLHPDASDILTVEFKTNLLAPASGTGFIFRAEVIKPGRTLTISEARAYALRDGGEHDRDHDRHVDGDGSPRGAERFRTSVVPGLI